MMAFRYKQLLTLLQHYRLKLGEFGWSEVVVLVVTLIVLICGYCFIELADEVREGETQSVDEWILRSLRRADDPAVPIGPAWVREAGLDLTALGSPAVLLLIVLGVIGLMSIQRQYGFIALTFLATSTGSIVAAFLKYLIERDRPAVVPHLREVTTPSFPSGHAMLSAVVYLTLGILLMQVVQGRAAKLYCLLSAMSLSFLVGISRIYLGVHYPTDVVAGWMAGIAWALACWAAVQGMHNWPTSFENYRRNV
ncbi:phosphatase PAP2 family protein [soil metagenome]